MSDLITVDVSFSQRVNYRGTVEMTRKDYETHCAKLDSLKGRELQRYEEDLWEEYFAHDDGDAEDPKLDDFCEREQK